MTKEISLEERPLEWLLENRREFIRRLDAASSARELGEALILLTKPFGVEAVLGGFLPADLHLEPLLSEPTPEELDLLTSYPSSMDQKAPVLLIDSKNQTTHFFYLNSKTDKVEHKLYTGQEAAAASALWSHFDGALFPIISLASAKCGFAFLGRDIQNNDAAIARLSCIAHYAFSRTLKIDEITEHLPKLTKRQLESLRWAAMGKTDQEIAEIMGLSIFTIDKYMRQCKEALNAVNRTALIVLAMRHGLIS